MPRVEQYRLSGTVIYTPPEGWPKILPLRAAYEAQKAKLDENQTTAHDIGEAVLSDVLPTYGEPIKEFSAEQSMNITKIDT